VLVRSYSDHGGLALRSRDYAVAGSLTVEASADATNSEVVLGSSPVINEKWKNVSIIARDSDRLALSNGDDDFSIELASGKYQISCAVLWMSFDSSYQGECDIPYVRATCWNLTVRLDDELMYHEAITALCHVGSYAHDGYCHDCPMGFDCAGFGATLETVPLTAGYWRSSRWSDEVYECTYGKTACRGRTLTGNASSYCNEGWTGPLCAEVRIRSASRTHAPP